MPRRSFPDFGVFAFSVVSPRHPHAVHGTQRSVWGLCPDVCEEPWDRSPFLQQCVAGDSGGCRIPGIASIMIKEKESLEEGAPLSSLSVGMS